MTEDLAKEFIESETKDAWTVEILGTIKTECKSCKRTKYCYDIRKTKGEETLRGNYCDECADCLFGIKGGM